MADNLTPERLKKVYEFWGKVYQAAAPAISRSTVAIYGHHQGTVRLNGSGVLVNIGDKHFLLSAAHVIDFPMFHDISYFLSASVQGQEPIPLDKVRAATSPVPEGRDEKDKYMRDDDPLDIGFIELNQSIVDRLQPVRRFATLREVDVHDRLKRGCYLILGYPYKLSPTDEVNKKVCSEPLRYITELCDDPEDQFDPTYQIRLKYPVSGLTADMAEVTVPNPKGMSGCGIWRLAEMKHPDQWSLNDVKLVGIDHMWHAERRYIQGTRVRHILKFIYRSYPSIRSIMDLHLGPVTRDW